MKEAAIVIWFWQELKRQVQERERFIVEKRKAQVCLDWGSGGG